MRCCRDVTASDNSQGVGRLVCALKLMVRELDGSLNIFDKREWMDFADLVFVKKVQDVVR